MSEPAPEGGRGSPRTGEPASAPRPLIATYRLQFHAGYPLAAARADMDFFSRLGISHLYASPLLAARRGSRHGYDVTDPTRLNPELGREADLAALAADLRRLGMGLIADIVPNHMAADPDNRWWWSVLTYGRDSPFSTWFDIDWQARGAGVEAAGRVLLPVLGAPLATVLARGELHLELRPEAPPRLRYYQHVFPLNPAPPSDQLDAPALRRWLDRQPYRLSYWRTASQQINYRRFFAVNELVGFRVEVPEAFQASHALLADWLRRGWIEGLRVDHVDGLFDPGAYLTRLRALVPAGPVWVEKILSDTESLPDDWPVDGTTGYDFLAWCDRLQVHPAGYQRLLTGYRRYLHRHLEFPSLTYGLKRQAIRSLFDGELRGFTRGAVTLARLSTAPAAAAVTPAAAQRILLALAASYPVYRTYAHRLGARGPALSPQDRAAAGAALHGAAAREPGLDPAAFAWLGHLVRGDPAAGLAPEHGPRWLRFLQRWQQFIAPVMAKGQEDTALYVYVPLASLDEVGGDPSHSTVAATAFHRLMRHRQQRWPRALNASSTHDTKRSEDVRARLDALSEIPDAWLRWVRQWSRWNRSLRTAVRRRPTPEPNTEYLYYQTLLGAWPLDDMEPEPADAVRAPEAAFVGRLTAYMRKAAREATLETQWTTPNLDYERALGDFIAASLDPARSPRFLAAVRGASRQLAPAGAVNSLVQLTLKALAPGVPDFYQGCERWNFSLVDPDNRRAADFEPSARALQRWEHSPPDPRALLAHWTDGEIKLWLTARLLALRRRFTALGPESDYQPLAIAGPARDHALAFCRRHGRQAVLVVIPRSVATAASSDRLGLHGFDWGDTRVQVPVPANEWWRDGLAADEDAGPTVAGGSELPLRDLLAPLPVAVYVTEQ